MILPWTEVRLRSTAEIAQANPLSGSSMARRNAHPVPGLPSSNQNHANRPTADPSSPGEQGQGRSAMTAVAHQARCRPAAAPLLRPWAPPDAAAQPIQARPTGASIAEWRQTVAPRARMAARWSPATTLV